MIDPIKDIENAIIKRIKTASDTGILEYKLPSVGSYGGEMDADIPAIVRNRTPSIWVTFLGEDNPGTKLMLPDCDISFAVIVYVRNVKSEATSRTGDDKEVGAYKIVYDIKKLLINQDLGLPIKNFELMRVYPIYNGQLQNHYSSIYGIVIKTRYRFDAAQKAYNDLNEFLRIKSVWTINGNESELDVNLRSKENA